VAAATALIVSLTGGSATPSSTTAASVPTTTVPSHSPQTKPRSGTAPAASPTTTPPPTSTSTTVAVAPAGPPVISLLNPASGSAGQSVTVSGANFLSSSGQIVATFNGQVAPTSCPVQSSCTVTVPTSSAPSAQVVITTAGGASNAATFTYD
jgi:IPT/TIG domain